MLIRGRPHDIKEACKHNKFGVTLCFLRARLNSGGLGMELPFFLLLIMSNLDEVLNRAFIKQEQ